MYLYICVLEMYGLYRSACIFKCTCYRERESVCMFVFLGVCVCVCVFCLVDCHVFAIVPDQNLDYVISTLSYKLLKITTTVYIMFLYSVCVCVYARVCAHACASLPACVHMCSNKYEGKF